MNAAHKIVVLVGSIFLAVGVFVGIIFAIINIRNKTNLNLEFKIWIKSI